MIFIGHDANGTNGRDLTLMFAIYELDGQQVKIPANTPENEIEVAVMAALAALDQPKPARQAYSNLIAQHQDLTIYADYFIRAQRDLVALWKTTPNLVDTTTAVYAAVRQNKASDSAHAAMYTRFLWYLTRTTAIALVSGDLPPTPTAAQAQVINACAYQFILNGFTVSIALLRG